MTDSPNEFSLDPGIYQRPNQEWECGHLADGCPCPIGPGGRGECLVNQICVPLKTDTGWACGRAKAWGGRCSEGPIPDRNAPDQQAVCPHAIPPCQPRHSLRRKRRLVSGIVAAASLGFCLFLLGGGSSPNEKPFIQTAEWISPGELTARHNTIQQGCSACHSAAHESPAAQLGSAFGGSRDIAESQKCLKCHEAALGHFALQPHGTDPAVLQAASRKQESDAGRSHNTLRQTLARMVVPHRSAADGELACATCHKEHRGREFDLKRITNDQCQICHSSSFHSLQDGHPDFTLPKHDQPPHLIFDHLTHYGMHFSADPETWLADAPNDTCSRCHVPDEAGHAMTVVSFEKSCADCHLDQIKADPLPELRIPGVTFLSLVPSDFAPGDDQNLPEAFPRTPPVMELLLLADEDYAATKQAADSGQAEADSLRTIAAARRRLITDLVANREVAIRNRLLKSLTNADSVLVTAAADALNGFWFFDTLYELQQRAMAAGDSSEGDGDGRKDGDSDDSAALAVSAETPITYFSQEHADAVLRTWIDLAASQATTGALSESRAAASVVDRLFASLVQPQTTGRCVKCHTVSSDSGHPVVNWIPRTSGHGGFTKFSHRPHITLLEQHGQVGPQETEPYGDRRCESCHYLAREEVKFARIGPALTSGVLKSGEHHEFSGIQDSMTLATCVNCHTPREAGNDCLKCHNYHVVRQQP
ncbi:MAG: hypothetical protein R3C19_21250 [Planctomycetaceae bacterium]